MLMAVVEFLAKPGRSGAKDMLFSPVSHILKLTCDLVC